MPRKNGATEPFIPTRRIVLPERPFFWTLDQVASILQVSEAWLHRRTSYTGRTLQTGRAMLRAVNLAEPDETPTWRVSNNELLRWLAHHGVNIKSILDAKRTERTMSNVPANRPGQQVATNPDLPDGLEDTDASDLTTPIYRINHEKGVFVNGMTNEEMPSFDVILLGRIKQRILWPMEVGGEGEAPMCRSYDFAHGIPRPETWVQPQKGNPALTAVKVSGWDYTQIEDAAAPDAIGLPCQSCSLKDWGQDRTPPWCNEQWTFPFLSLDDNDQPLSPGVISFQRTGLKPCKTYVSGFVQAKSALYTVVTRLTAVPQQRGSVKWVTPSFQRLRDSDPTQWNEFSMALHQIKDFLTTPRTFTTEPDPDDEEVATATRVTATVSKPAPTPNVQPAPTPEPTPEPIPETEQEAPPVARAQPVTATPSTPPPARGKMVPSTPPSTFEDEEPFVKFGDHDFSFKNLHLEL